MPNLVPVDHDPFADDAPSTSLPQAGDPTSYTGASAGGLTTPGRYDPDTMRAFAIDLMANGGKGAAGILNNDPGQQYARSYATTQAANQAGLDFKQKMTAPLLDQLHHMRQIATDAGPAVLSEATGPDYTEGTDPNSWWPSFSMDTSGQRYQNLRAWGQALNLPGRALAYLAPDSSNAPSSSDVTGSSVVPYPTDVYDDAAKLNLQMQHIKKGLGAAVKALPGSKGAGASTDQDQGLVLDAVGEALHAQDPETFFKILYDAENLLRGRSGMPALPPPTSYLPPEWSKSSPASGTNQSAVTSIAPTSTAAISPRSSQTFPVPPREAVQQLRQNSSAKQRAYFDQIFGPGSSSRAMAGAF